MRRVCAAPRRIAAQKPPRRTPVARVSFAGLAAALFGRQDGPREAMPTSEPPKEGNVVVQIEEIKDIARRAIQTYGYRGNEVDDILDVLMYAQLRGNNQGIIKITTNAIARPADAVPMEIEHETQVSARINGNKQPGMVVLKRATELAIKKAQRHGVGIVGTNHTFTSTGALGYYAERIANDGFIALVFAQSPEYVAPYGSKEPIFGTNPIGIAIPTAEGPIVMDMATSAYAYFGLLEARTAGRSIPDNVAYDSEGNPTTDPVKALEGAIRVFDRSYKGSNLALMVEMLAGPLVGAATQDKSASKNWGNLVCAIDPKLLGTEDFESKARQVAQRVKNAEKLPGVEEILLPGERGSRSAQQHIKSGVLPVEQKLFNDLTKLAAKFVPEEVNNGATENNGKEEKKPHYKAATVLLHPTFKTEDPFNASSPPLYQTATFGQPSSTTFLKYDYTRSGNPTRDVLEMHMAELEGADRAFAFTSGMAAITAIARLAGVGEKIVTGNDIYGGTSRLLSQVVPKQGVVVENVDMTDLAAVEKAITENTRVVLIESPTNPRMEITDIRKVCEIAHRMGAIVAVDNSIMTPVFQLPIKLGADISMISATKFIGGHSDITGGILAVKGEKLASQIYFHQNAEGTGLAPFDCWLSARGIKTMSVRMERQNYNAMRIAEYLERHPLVKQVNFPGLTSHPQHKLHCSQATGCGSVLSFITGDVDVSRHLVDKTKLFKITVSFGNVNSLISMPCFMSHASIPAEVRAARGLPDDLVRIAAGIEDVDDLLDDLDAAFQGAAKMKGMSLDTMSSNGRVSAREQELMRRIMELEQKIANLSSSSN